MKQDKTIRPKRYKLALLLIVVMALSTIFALPLIPEQYAKRLLPALFPEGTYHYDKLEVDPYKGIATFSNFELKQQPAFGDATLLSSPRLEVQFKPFQQIKESVTLEYVHFDRPSLTVLAASDGSLNAMIPASESSAKFLHIKELRAPELQLIWIDQTAEDTYSELIATNISLNAFNIMLTGKGPSNNLIDEIIVDAPQMLFARTGREIRKRHDNLQLQVRKLKVMAGLFTYEDNTVQPNMLDIGITNLVVRAENLIFGPPLASIVHPSPIDVTGHIVQSGSISPMGIIGNSGPMDGRQTQLNLVAYAMGLQLDLLSPLFKGDRRKSATATAALGGNVFDLKMDMKGTLAALKCRLVTDSPRGTHTDSTFMLNDDDQNHTFWTDVAFLLTQPKTANISAFAEQIPIDVKVKTWHNDIIKRAEAYLERSRKERTP
ncbi:MAG: hypothetical protein ACI9TH_002391 [Kiritimatiellia bacterium]